MSAFNWIKKLRRDERGNVLVVGAATMPLLMGSAALAIDTVQLTLWKRQLQRTADSAAIAGAYALAQDADMNAAVNNDLDENIDRNRAYNERPTLTETIVTPGSFADGAIAPDSCADRGISPCYNRAVQVALTAERSLPFLRMFTGSTNTLQAEATAALVTDGEYCMVSLYDEDEPGIDAGGNSNLALGCGMITNSKAANAIVASGTANITASPAAAVGGIAGGSHFADGTVLQPYSAPALDPFGDRPDPVKPSDCDSGKLQVANNTLVDLTDPAVAANYKTCYASWDIKGTLKLAPGTYYVDGGLLDLHGRIEGTGVTIVLLGDTSDMRQNGGGQLAISAPSSGDMKGIAMWRDRTADNVTIKINGGADTVVTGAFYMKSSDIWIGGNSDISAQCLQVVGRILTFKGGGSIGNNCTADSGSGAFKQTIVRLVS